MGIWMRMILEGSLRECKMEVEGMYTMGMGEITWFGGTS
jgi:hypothetical protein